MKGEEWRMKNLGILNKFKNQIENLTFKVYIFQ